MTPEKNYVEFELTGSANMWIAVGVRMFLFNEQHTELIQPDAEFYNLVAPHAPPLTVFV